MRRQRQLLIRSHLGRCRRHGHQRIGLVHRYGALILWISERNHAALQNRIAGPIDRQHSCFCLLGKGRVNGLLIRSRVEATTSTTATTAEKQDC